MQSADKPHYGIEVRARSQYVPEQSEPSRDRYVFAYRVTIENNGAVAAQLLNRHWIITDANGKVQEVRGEGVIGEQPRLEPGASFRYTSGTVIGTPVGSMQGSYEMVAESGIRFDVVIPPFSLATPTSLH